MHDSGEGISVLGRLCTCPDSAYMETTSIFRLI